MSFFGWYIISARGQWAERKKYETEEEGIFVAELRSRTEIEGTLRVWVKKRVLAGSCPLPVPQSFREQTYFFLNLQATSCHPSLRSYANWTQSSFPWLSGCWPHHCFFTSHFVYFHSVQSDQLLWLKSVQCWYSVACSVASSYLQLPSFTASLPPTHTPLIWEMYVSIHF